ncbi:prepilin-type cleavage/methylation domain-containing protein [Enterobacterales bacterium CwR94]|nr:prepilin-type cleavage/methylation domain-containing protein [Enterobacterales bacterium CwR94]
MKTAEKGFSLMELMIVMVIVAVLSGSAAFGWHTWQQQQHLRDSAQQLYLFLLRLRSDAHWRNTEHKLVWKAAEQGSITSEADRNALWTFIPPWPDVYIRSMTGEPGFYGKRDTAWPGSIDVTSAVGRWRVIISAQGRVRLCRPDREACQ